MRFVALTLGCEQVFAHSFLRTREALDLLPRAGDRWSGLELEIADAFALCGEFAQGIGDTPGEAHGQCHGDHRHTGDDDGERREIVQRCGRELAGAGIAADPQHLFAEPHRPVEAQPAFAGEFEVEGLGCGSSGCDPCGVAAGQERRACLADRAAGGARFRQGGCGAVRRDQNLVACRKQRGTARAADRQQVCLPAELAQQQIEGKDVATPVAVLPVSGYGQPRRARGVETVRGGPVKAPIARQGQRTDEPGPAARIVVTHMPFGAGGLERGVPALPFAAPADAFRRGGAAAPTVGVAQQEEFAAILVGQKGARDARLGRQQRGHQANEAGAIADPDEPAAAPLQTGRQQGFGRPEVTFQQIENATACLVERSRGEAAGGRSDDQVVKGRTKCQPAHQYQYRCAAKQAAAESRQRSREGHSQESFR